MLKKFVVWNLAREIDTIKNSFLKLGYGTKFIDKGHFKARRKFYQNITDGVQENKPFIVLPQTGHDNKF